MKFDGCLSELYLPFCKYRMKMDLTFVCSNLAEVFIAFIHSKWGNFFSPLFIFCQIVSFFQQANKTEIGHIWLKMIIRLRPQGTLHNEKFGQIFSANHQFIFDCQDVLAIFLKNTFDAIKYDTLILFRSIFSFRSGLDFNCSVFLLNESCSLDTDSQMPYANKPFAAVRNHVKLIHVVTSRRGFSKGTVLCGGY